MNDDEKNWFVLGPIEALVTLGILYSDSKSSL